MGLREDLRGTWFDEVMSGIGRVAEKGFKAAAPAMEGAAHVATAPARAVTAAGHAIAGEEGGGWGGDPLDYILYGFDPETGRRPAGYGELLGEAVESETDLPPTAADAARLLGTLISDPVVLSAGVGAAGAASRPPMPRAPRPVGLPTQGQVYPQYAPPGAIPTPPAAAAPPPPPPTPPMPPAATGGAGGVGGIPYTQLYKWFRG